MSTTKTNPKVPVLYDGTNGREFYTRFVYLLRDEYHDPSKDIFSRPARVLHLAGELFFDAIYEADGQARETLLTAERLVHRVKKMSSLSVTHVNMWDALEQISTVLDIQDRYSWGARNLMRTDNQQILQLKDLLGSYILVATPEGYKHLAHNKDDWKVYQFVSEAAAFSAMPELMLSYPVGTDYRVIGLQEVLDLSQQLTDPWCLTNIWHK